tara:strand:+ start:331 stop:585 length:255 start_codon:yes stop_codon:yes gene_type:complete
MNLFIDEWTAITTPKGEKIKIHFETIRPSISLPPSEDDENKINVYFYKVRDKKVRDITQVGQEPFEVLSLKPRDISFWNNTKKG